jgi:large subunit ribosomal protein L15
MTITLNNLSKDKRSTKSRVRVGRGNASGHGSFSGRGCKGQRSRSGGKKGLKYKGMKRTIANSPKFKGMKPLVGKETAVWLSTLNKHFQANETVSPKTLFEKQLVDGPTTRVKILNTGAIDHAIMVEGCKVSTGAVQAIEKAGGKVTVEQPAVEEAAN